MQTAAALRGFGPLGILAMLLILVTGNIVLPNMIVLPVGAALVLLWVRLSATPWADVGYAAPRSWLLSAALGIILGVALKLVMKAVVMPLLGADPVNQAYHFLAGNRALLPAAIIAMPTVGFSEETVFRGYLFERLERLGVSKPIVVLLTSAFFGAVHYTGQGWAGVEQAAVVGLVFGAIFARTRRIFLPMVAHAAFDLTALALIYYDVEANVARLVWKL
jgi:membrane protease YdiL (CAAX protease family)